MILEPRGGRGTNLFGLSGYVQLNRVCFLEQGHKISLAGVLKRVSLKQSVKVDEYRSTFVIPTIFSKNSYQLQ